MKKYLLILCAALLVSAPVCAKPAKPATATVPVGSSAVPASSATPVASTTPVSSSAPAPVEDAGPATPRPADLSPGKVTAGDLTLSDMNAVVKGGDIDFTMSVKNNSKAADKVIGYSTDDWAGTSVELADGKKDNTLIPAEGKADIHLIIKGASSAQIKSGELPITFYFGRGPNTKLKVYVSGHQSLGSRIMGIFK